MNRFGIVVSAVILAVTISTAQDQTPRADKRQQKQEKRIEQGTKSGELNAREAKRLEREQTKIERHEEKAKSDGVVTKRERARLQHEQNKASRHIYKEKHDRQKSK